MVRYFETEGCVSWCFPTTARARISVTNLSHTGILFIIPQKLSLRRFGGHHPGHNKQQLSAAESKIDVVRIRPSKDKYAVVGKIVENQ